MGLFGRRRARGAPIWQAIPPGDWRIAAWVQPGETCFDPVLGVIDWQEYVASLNERPRKQSIRASDRDLMLTDRRMLAFDHGRGRRHEFFYSRITEVSLVGPPGKPVAGGECVIRLLWTVEDGRTKFVDSPHWLSYPWKARSDDRKHLGT